jgi:hypothetical protein
MNQAHPHRRSRPVAVRASRAGGVGGSRHEFTTSRSRTPLRPCSSSRAAHSGRSRHRRRCFPDIRASSK